MLKIEQTNLNEETLKYGLQILSNGDPDLARALEEVGSPPMWKRKTGFSTLIHIILEQQVSLASARAAYKRLLSTVVRLTPPRFLKLDEVTLKRIGFSRKKISYSRNLACSIIEGQINIKLLGGMNDEEVKAVLTRVKGIGNWTADIYLLMAL